MTRENAYTYKVLFNESENAMLQELTDNGFRQQDIFRLGLRIIYRKEMPLYAKKSRQREKGAIKNEGDCINEGGEVLIEEGVRKCKITKDNVEYYIVI